MIKLTRAGFKLRSFMSHDGENIYTVIYAADENLSITAEKDKMNKRLNFEFSDLLSMEPVDSSLRPLRIHSSIWMDDTD